MKIKLENLYMAYPIFNRLLMERLPVKTAVKVRNLIISLSDTYEEIQKIQDSVIHVYANKDASGVYEMPENKETDYLDDMRSRLQKEVDVEWEKISVEDLGDYATITPKELESLSFLFNDLTPAVV
tara:strand:+ start:566 stop:943 length:378 start_codon:yes stop_codon:yes gene_type:complete